MTTRTLTGDYIADLSIDVDDPYNPVTTVEGRFTDTMARAETVYGMLIGDGSTTTGMLGAMQSALASAPTISISSPTVDTSLTFASSGLSVPAFPTASVQTLPTIDTAITFSTSGLTVPTFDTSTLQAFPTTPPTGPTVGTLPTITTDFSSITAPTDPTLVLSWAESALPSDVYSALYNTLSSVLSAGDTGINSTVEAAIYTRARNRQLADRTAEYNRINDTALQMQFALPSGVLTSALTDFGLGANRQDADIENTIIVTQAERAQANIQFSLNAAVALEGLIRQTRTDESGRALDYAKALAAETRELFAAKIQKYLAQWEQAKVTVQAQAEALKGALDAARTEAEVFKAEYDALKNQADAVSSANKNLVDVFTGRVQGYASAEQAVAASNDIKVKHLDVKFKSVDAVSAANKNLVDVFTGQVQGYSEAERAIASANENLIKHLAEKIKNAENVLRAATVQAEQTVAGYASEQSIKERFASDVAQIAAQVCASMLSAVHAGASISYSGTESSNQSIHLGATVSESHNAEHDPVA